MKKVSIVSIIALIFTFQLSCQNSNDNKKITQKATQPIEVKNEDGFKRAYFASGCFWCVEAIYESVKGVKEVVSGYSGGHTKNPTYESSNTGKTGHAEAVEVIYNPDIINFKQLVDVYFGSQNISQINSQGPDRGSQYRSIIFYQNDFEKEIIDKKIKSLKKEDTNRIIAAEVVPFQKFWKAEDYHQNYERLHPENSYIQNISIPRLRKFQKKYPELLKEKTNH